MEAVSCTITAGEPAMLMERPPNGSPVGRLPQRGPPDAAGAPSREQPAARLRQRQIEVRPGPAAPSAPRDMSCTGPRHRGQAGARRSEPQVEDGDPVGDGAA